VDIAFLIAYLALVVVSYARVRSVSWLAIALAFSVSAFGVLVSLGDDLGHSWTRVELQVMLLLALVAVLLVGLRRGRMRLSSLKRQLYTILIPVVILLVGLVVLTTVWTSEPAFLHPVSFLMGHSVAEDNAKWLDFTSQLATGNGIVQGVPMGGPLALYLTFVATAMGVISQVFLHGYNEVAVAANSVVFGQFLLVVLTPLFLAPLAEARLRAHSGQWTRRLPLPFIWLSTLILASTVLLVTAYGHMTLQFVLLICSLWAVTFLSQVPIHRARLLTSLVIAAAMTVWLPLNVLAVVILVGWLVILVSRPIRLGRSELDVVGLLLWLVFAVCLWQPIKSSLTYFLTPAVSADGVAGAGGGLVSASSPIRTFIRASLDQSGLFSSSGGTEQTQPILAILAAGSVVAAVVYLSRQAVARPSAVYRRFAPIALLAFFALAIYALDFWSTGGGPHYGSMKFTFMATIVALTACVPFALMLIDRKGGSRMTPVRWIAVAAIVYLMVIDSFLPRSLAAARPQQWSPAIPFDNPKSYWWPADVNGTGNQSIAGNPVGCVYLPQGAKVPSALLVSQLSDAQRVYACTRILAGLSGQDAEAQPLVDWLRREWLGNKGAWSDVYGYLDSMPDAVKDKQMIILDDGSNVIGLDTVRYLLERYPASAGLTPAP
jgi:hypothetical protein